MDVFEGRQLTAARALADLSLADLARDAHVTIRTVHRLEVGGTAHISEKRRHGFVSREIWRRLVDALARHGVEIIPESVKCGSGVRWLRPRSDRAHLQDFEGRPGQGELG